MTERKKMEYFGLGENEIKNIIPAKSGHEIVILSIEGGEINYKYVKSREQQCKST